MFTVMSLNLKVGADQERWTEFAKIIKRVSPQVVLLQEAVGWLTLGDTRLAIAQNDTGMRGQIAASGTGFNTGILIDESAAKWGEWITYYNHTSLHGHAELTVHLPGLPLPIVLMSAHLTPYSAAAAAQEAQVLIGRSYDAGGLGIIGGDINHVPPGDPEPAWEQITHPWDLSSRTVTTDPVLRANTIVGQVLARGGLVDVAAYLADKRNDPTLRASTGRAGMVRADQFHITPSLVPALVDYYLVDCQPWSDHDGVVMTIDPAKISEPPEELRSLWVSGK